MPCRVELRAANRSVARASGTSHQICRGAATCGSVEPGLDEAQVSRLGQVDSRTAPLGESASSAHIVAFAAAPNWLFHARCGRPSGGWTPKTSECASLITSLPEQRERQPVAQGPGEGGLARCGEAVHECLFLLCRPSSSVARRDLASMGLGAGVAWMPGELVLRLAGRADGNRVLRWHD